MEQKIQVAIVEDIEAARKNIEEMINKQSDFILAGSFSNGEDALEYLVKNPCNVVIMDINLPGISGIECVRKIKGFNPMIQIMMFTIFENTDLLLEALKAGANGYLIKKNSPAKIPDAIRELFNGGAPMSAQIARKLVEVFQNQVKNEYNLNKREEDILFMLSKGLLYKEVASSLKISESYLKKKIHMIYEKLHVQNKTEALAIIDRLAQRRLDLSVITKLSLSKPFIQRLSEIAQSVARAGNIFSFSVSILCAESARQWEPKVPSPEKRIETLKRAYKAGIKTLVAFRPLLPTLSDAEMEAVVKATKSYCYGFYSGALYLKDPMHELLPDTSNLTIERLQPAWMPKGNIFYRIEKPGQMQTLREILQKYNKPLFEGAAEGIKYLKTL